MIRADFLVPGGALAGALARHIDRRRSVGERVGSYRLMALIGQGGMGEVWRAERDDGAYQQTVAIKFATLANARSGRVLLEHERQLLAGLEHPHIARVVDGGTSSDGDVWFAMAWIDGAPLDRALTSLTLDARLRLFDQLCAAVAYAHRRLVIHRDIKPSSVLVDARGAHLLDFGIASWLDRDRDESAGFSTPQWASPEQRAGSAVSTASDVYQLGRLLAMLLDPAKPSASDATQRVHSEASSPPKLPPGPLTSVVRKATASAPQERYATVDALAEDVQRYRDGREVQAHGGGLVYGAGLFVRRWRYSLAALALALLIAIGGTVAAFVRVQAARGDAEREAARAQRVADFLERILIEGSPTRAGGERPTVDALLVQAEARIDNDFGDQPALRARLLGLLARVHIEHEAHGRAAPLLREAVAIDGDAAREPEALRRLMMYGAALHQMGESAAGLRALQAAQARANDLDLTLRNQIERNLTQVQYQMGDVQRAIEGMRTASERVERERPASSLLVANLINLGQFEAAAGHDSATETLTRAYELSQRVNGAEHPHTLLAGMTNVTSLGARGDHARAVALGKELARRVRLVFGDPSAHYANALMALGYAQERAGLLDAATTTYERSLAGWHALPEGSDLNSVTVLQQLGDIAMAKGDTRRAIEHYREMLARNAADRHAADPDLGQRPLRLAKALIAAGGCGEIAGLLAQARDRSARAPDGHAVHSLLAEVEGECPVAD